MSRQTRLILLLAGMALVGVMVLGAMAQRYSKALLKPEPGSSATQRDVERHVKTFVRVRLALRAEVDPPALDGIAADARALAFAARRDRALSAARMEPADYRMVRGHYRKWSQAPDRLDPAWRTVLERHRDALQSCGLGELEALDR